MAGGEEPYWLPNMDACKHSYEVAMADGPESDAICVWCGKKKRLKNYVEAAIWREDRELALAC